jgi:hypothetical protein
MPDAGCRMPDAVIRDRARACAGGPFQKCEGVARWGGDDRTPDESLFYIDVAPGDERLSKVVAKIRGWVYTPGKGSGVLVDTLEPQRRNAAKRLAGQQA